jgi:hypothetical protein
MVSWADHDRFKASHYCDWNASFVAICQSRVIHIGRRQRERKKKDGIVGRNGAQKRIFFYYQPREVGREGETSPTRQVIDQSHQRQWQKKKQQKQQWYQPSTEEAAVT